MAESQEADNELLPMFDVLPTSWQERALCAQTDPEAFFPEKGGSTRDAKRVCQSCEVRVECLEYAMRYPLNHIALPGIYAGMTERERQFRASLFDEELRKK